MAWIWPPFSLIILRLTLIFLLWNSIIQLNNISSISSSLGFLPAPANLLCFTCPSLYKISNSSFWLHQTNAFGIITELPCCCFLQVPLRKFNCFYYRGDIIRTSWHSFSFSCQLSITWFTTCYLATLTRYMNRYGKSMWAWHTLASIRDPAFIL